MKVIAQTQALQDALGVLSSIVSTRTPKPVLECIKLVASADGLELMGTDLEVGCRYLMTAVQVEQPGEALVPATKFSGIVREATSDDSLTIESDKEATVVKGTGSRFKIFGFDPAEYPAIDQFPAAGDFKVPAAVLKDMISKTLFATAKAHSHYAISGVLWEATGKNLKLVATDGHRLAQALGMLESGASSATAIVPAKFMGLILRVCSPEDMLDVKIEGNQIMVKSATATLMSTLVQGNFPKYSDVIPQNCDRHADINTGEFQHRVRQAALLTNDESRGVKLSFQPDSLVMSSRAPEAGEAEVQCPIVLNGNPTDIGFNPQFLLDALKVVDTDMLRFEMSAPNKPAMIKAGPDFLYVLMPVDLG